MNLMRAGVAAIFVWLLGANGVQAAPVATVEVVDGVVTAGRTAGKRVVLAKGSALEEGDVVTTEQDSYARLRFTDGGEMALRPLTTVNIRRYRFELARPAQDALVLDVVKGGMRTVTGLIGKRGNENAYRVQGTTATIGIRGTEYVLRECHGDCAVERKGGGPMVVGGNAQARKTPPPPLPVAARLVAVQGKVQIREGSKVRDGAVGDPLYRGETVIVSRPGHAALEFNDRTRVVLDQGSEYQLTNVRFNPETPEKGSGVTSLIKGGLRMITGTLGKKKPESVKVETVVATIGIRGTNFDAWCVPSGSHRPGEAIQLPEVPSECREALFAATRDGAIELSSGEHQLLVPAGRVGYVDGPGARPELLEADAVAPQRAPAPESLTIDHVALFGVDGSHKTDPGLYVSVKDGAVSLLQDNGDELVLRRGEVGFAGTDGKELLLLEGEPEFIYADPYLREMNVDPSTCRAQ